MLRAVPLSLNRLWRPAEMACPQHLDPATLLPFVAAGAADQRRKRGYSPFGTPDTSKMGQRRRNVSFTPSEGPGQSTESPWVSVKGREYSVRGNVAFPTILGFPALGRTELEIFTRCERTLVLSASSAGPYSRSGSEIHTIWGRGSSGVHSEIVDIRAFRRSKHLLEDLFERASRGYE